jgi:hypothetical protein
MSDYDKRNPMNLPWKYQWKRPDEIRHGAEIVDCLGWNVASFRISRDGKFIEWEEARAKMIVEAVNKVFGKVSP